MEDTFFSTNLQIHPPNVYVCKIYHGNDQSWIHQFYRMSQPLVTMNKHFHPLAREKNPKYKNAYKYAKLKLLIIIPDHNNNYDESVHYANDVAR